MGILSEEASLLFLPFLLSRAHYIKGKNLLLKEQIISLKSRWLVGCFGLNSPLRQYFSLYWAVSQREGEGKEK